MPDTNKLILASLAAGAKARSVLASELKLSPTKVAGALVRMVNAGQVVVSGKTRGSRKDVSVYAVANQPKVKCAPPAVIRHEPDAAVTARANPQLYQVWGGYAELGLTPAMKSSVRRHIAW